MSTFSGGETISRVIGKLTTTPSFASDFSTVIYTVPAGKYAEISLVSYRRIGGGAAGGTRDFRWSLKDTIGNTVATALVTIQFSPATVSGLIDGFIADPEYLLNGNIMARDGYTVVLESVSIGALAFNHTIETYCVVKEWVGPGGIISL